MSFSDHIVSFAADFIARVTAYLFGMQESYAPRVTPRPESSGGVAGPALVRGLAWDGRRLGASRIYTTPTYAPHLLLSGKPAIRLADAKRCPRRCLAQRWLEKFRVYLTYDCTARGDVVLPPASPLTRIIVGRGPPVAAHKFNFIFCNAQVLIWVDVGACACALPPQKTRSSLRRQGSFARQQFHNRSLPAQG